MIEAWGTQFALCGSSARKIKRGHANLLGGRAIRFELYGLVSHELGDAFDLDRLVNHGYLPSIYEADDPRRLLDAYVGLYLREEVAADGLVRNLPVFAEFLSVAALSDTEIINASTIARDCGVSSHAIKAYFDILEDTLLGKRVPSYRRRPKRRVVASPKFYFTDVGIVNFLCKRGGIERGSELYGKAFENWVFHELLTYDLYRGKLAQLAYWRLSSGIEVDFIVGDMQVAIESKATETVRTDHLRGLRALMEDHPEVQRRVVVSLAPRRRTTQDGIEVWPAHQFAAALWRGEFF